jgi:hypothetical protein
MRVLLSTYGSRGDVGTIRTDGATTATLLLDES